VGSETATIYGVPSGHVFLCVLTPRLSRRVISHHGLFSRSVFLVILSVFFENSGMMKQPPKLAQFEPTDGKTVKFGDVHGVDEAKDVCDHLTPSQHS
jgi:hypothetical protein